MAVGVVLWSVCLAMCNVSVCNRGPYRIQLMVLLCICVRVCSVGVEGLMKYVSLSTCLVIPGKRIEIKVNELGRGVGFAAAIRHYGSARRNFMR